MDVDRELAIAQLEALATVPGALRVITAEVQPALRETKRDPRSPARADVDLTRPASFVCHDVVAVQGPDARGRYRAVTAEGDFCEGQPAALLRRLTEAGSG